MRIWLLVAALAGVAFLPSASALVVGVGLDYEDAEHCILPPDLPCPIGHDPGDDPGIGDDTFYYSTLFSVDVDVDPGVPGVPPIRYRAGEDQPVEYPLFRKIEDALMLADQLLPEPVHDFVDFQNGTTNDGRDAWWATLCVPEVLPPDVLYPCRKVPFVYEPPFERDRFYPLPRISDNTYGSDDVLDDLADIAGDCLYELKQAAPPVCAAVNETARQAVDRAKDVLPAVYYDAGVEETEADLANQTALAPLAAGGEGVSFGALQTREGPHPGLWGDEADPANGRAAAWDAPLPGDGSHRSARSGDLAPRSQSARAALPVPFVATLSWLPWAAAASSALAVAAVLYRRITRERALTHPHRRALVELAREKPGITTGQAATELGLNYKTVRRHADLLLRDGHLVAQPLGRMRKLFPNHGAYGSDSRAALLALQRPGAARMWELLHQLGPLPRSDLERLAGLSRTSAFESLRALRQHGWVGVSGEGPAARVHAVEPQSPEPPTRVRVPVGCRW